MVKNLFDFQAATREFTNIINSGDTKNEQGEPIYYKIDHKSLQLRWTDIEIRKYRLRQGKQVEEDKSPEKGSTQTTLDEEDDDLPPLEEKPKETEGGAATGSDSDGERKVAYYTNLEELD